MALQALLPLGREGEDVPRKSWQPRFERWSLNHPWPPTQEHQIGLLHEQRMTTFVWSLRCEGLSVTVTRATLANAGVIILPLPHGIAGRIKSDNTWYIMRAHHQC